MAFVFEGVQDELSSPTLFPERDPAAPPAARSTLALRYGMSNHKMFAGTGKSGITPISPPNINQLQPPSPDTLCRADIHEDVQRGRLMNFTSWELVDSGSWMTDNVKPHDFGTTGIHAVFAPDNWIPGNIPIGPNLGVWAGGNITVWNILEPCLKLATLFIESNAVSPWSVQLFPIYGSNAHRR
jgi:hypothetical protein